MRRILFIAGLGLLLPTASRAQTCLGAPSFATSRGNVAMGASFFDGGRTYSGGPAVAVPIGLDDGDATFGVALAVALGSR